MDSVRQIFSNCRLYHPAESEEAECGRRLREYFQGRLVELGLTPKKSGSSRRGKRISSGEEGGGEEPAPVPEKLLTKTWLAVNELREGQRGTRQLKAKFSAVHECLLEELCVHPDSAPFLKLPSRRQVRYIAVSGAVCYPHCIFFSSPVTPNSCYHGASLSYVSCACCRSQCTMKQWKTQSTCTD